MINRNSVTVAPIRTPYWALRSLPPFPPIAVSLLHLLSGDGVDINQLVDLIQSDPRFTAELLRIASPAPSRSRENIWGVRHAVAMLGNETLKCFALSLTLRIYLRPTVRDPILAGVWRRALATAVLSDLLAEAFPALPPGEWDEIPYVAGLLYHLGSPGLMVADPITYSAALATAAEQRLDLRNLEKKLFDIDHCEAGRWIALKWRFSPALADLARGDHQLLSPVQCKLPDVVKIADLLATSLGFAIVPVEAAVTPDAVRAMLPPAVQARFLYTGRQLKSMVDERIGALLEDKPVTQYAEVGAQ